jgi:hypothetical protein
MKQATFDVLKIAVLAFLLTLTNPLHGQGTAFTYQGHLQDAGSTANGIYDLTFAVYDAPSAGSLVGVSNVFNDLPISNGLFTVVFDPGPGVFTGAARWLQIAVRPGSSSQAYTNLVPRQGLSPSPYAIMAGNLSGTIQSSNIAPGSIGSAQLAKPPQSGSIASASLTTYFNQAIFSVPFNPVFGTTPNVTVSLEIGDFATAQQSVLFVKSRSTSSFTGYVGLPTSPVNLDTASVLVGRSSLAVVNGNPAMSYSFVPDLKYVRASDANGTSWNAPVTVDSTGTVGEFNSLAVVNGNPAIAYYDGLPNLNLKYVRASNVNGTAWGTPVTVDSTGDVGQDPCMVVVNGNPAISYYDHTGLNLKYVRSTDIGGTNWAVAITVDATGNAGYANSMAVVNGNPAIAYGVSGPDSLRYARATDASGTTWSAPTTVDATAVFGDISLALINGNPAISYFDAINGRVKFIRATDVNGTTWGTALTLDTPGGTDGFTSLAVVSGNPALSYYDSVHGDLKFTRASDANGATWPGVLTVDDAGSVGFYTTLRVVNGQPAISYLDGTDGQLRYMRSTGTTVPFAINWIALEP